MKLKICILVKAKLEARFLIKEIQLLNEDQDDFQILEYNTGQDFLDDFQKLFDEIDIFIIDYRTIDNHTNKILKFVVEATVKYNKSVILWTFDNIDKISNIIKDISEEKEKILERKNLFMVHKVSTDMKYFENIFSIALQLAKQQKVVMI